jgi:chromosome segregation ATPase
MKPTSLLFLALLGTLTVAVPVKSVPKSSSVPLPTPRPPAQAKVENYISVLKKDLDGQEATLRDFVSRAELERGSKSKQLASLTAIMNHLHEQLLNTTKYYHEYNQNVQDVSSKLRPLTVEYDRANALYSQTKRKLEEEKKFLDTLLVYIRARNKSKC